MIFKIRCILANYTFRLGIQLIPRGPVRNAYVKGFDVVRSEIERFVSKAKEVK